MKRVLIAVVLIFLIACVCVGCSRMGMCANCGQYETLHEFKDHSGRSKYYCEDCYRMAKLFES